jgi:hypothetical protein
MLDDKSQATRTRLLVCRNLSAFRELNPTQYEGGRFTWSADQQRQRQEGQITGPIFPPTAPVAVEQVPCDPGTLTFLSLEFETAPPPFNAVTYNDKAILSWEPLPKATSYSVSISDSTPGNSIIDYVPGTTSVNIYYNIINDILITVTAQTPCGPTSQTGPIACFLAGAQVQMADNTTKAIEDVQVGDKVVGAFGEINTVLALQHLELGNTLMCNINNEHHSTNHHPHIGSDKKMYCGNPALVLNDTYGKQFKVIDETGQTVDMLMHGLKKTPVHQLTIGQSLKTVDGQRIVNTMETYNLPPETPIYNLVVSGSHTYHVDGYAVTGWARDDDFDYGVWLTSASA